MEEQIKQIIEHYTLNAFQVALISVLVSAITFFITSYLKNYFEKLLHINKLEADHRFDQQKKIKEVLARNKVHLLAACESLNHRMWNFDKNYKENWMKVDGKFDDSGYYYFHSFVYRFLAVYSWISKIQREMVFLDTTIATNSDLELVKFLKVFPTIFCDLKFIEGEDSDGSVADDHFFRNTFESFQKVLVGQNSDIEDYDSYTKKIPNIQNELQYLYIWFDGISPEEKRKRWERLYFLKLTLVLFLNNYGYDYQITDENKMEEFLKTPKIAPNINQYFSLLEEYRLKENKEVKKLRKIIDNIK